MLIPRRELTPENIAILGAFDDFYAAYNECLEIFNNYITDKSIVPVKATNDTYPYPTFKYKDILINYKEIEQLREILQKRYCEVLQPLLQKYRYIFTDTEVKMYANEYESVNEYGFGDFFMFYTDRNKTDGKLTLEEYSFPIFLTKLQEVVVKIFSMNQNNRNPHRRFKVVENSINRRIKNLIKNQVKHLSLDKTDLIESTKAPLDLFENLYGTTCYRNNHPMEFRTYNADLCKKSKIVLLPAHYCSYCKKYFIGVKTLSLFESNYGKLLLENRKTVDTNTDFGSFQAESKLHRLGYNVIDGEMSEQERRNLLVHLLENNMISYFEICSTIEQDIRLFQNSTRHQLAVKKWKDDLRYIGEWVLKKT